MQYHVLAADYDGTLAEDGLVSEATVDALRRLKATGRRLVMVTGRRLEPLLELFPQLPVFDLVVAENGGLLYWPETKAERVLCEPPPTEFVEALIRRGVQGLEVGRAIVATWTPHEIAVLETIRDLALELEIIFNKGAVMVLPTGVNKASGLTAALNQMRLSPRNTVGVGDAENDEAFLKFSELSAAVDNALPPVKQRADLVLTKPRGAGVTELIDRLLEDDFATLRGQPKRSILIGTDRDGEELRVPVYGTRLLVTGGPAAGKSIFALSVLERLTERGYQTLIIDPEGDYQELKDAVALGTAKRPPAVEEAVRVIEESFQDCVVGLFGMDHDEQPAMCTKLLRALLDLRSRMGRPHWLLLDEAHYITPVDWEPADDLNTDELHSMMMVTAFPDRLSNKLLRSSDLVVAMGDDPRASLAECGALLNETPPEPAGPEDADELSVLGWWRREGVARWFRRIPPESEHVRHQHNYLEGDLEEGLRFYFRGPDGALKLPAQNLKIFMQLAEGVDDETWLHHLRAGDYSKWFRDVILDDELAAAAEAVERDGEMPPQVSRERINNLIRERYLKEV